MTCSGCGAETNYEFVCGRCRIVLTVEQQIWVGLAYENKEKKPEEWNQAVGFLRTKVQAQLHAKR